jgi:hypothetical protein
MKGSEIPKSIKLSLWLLVGFCFNSVIAQLLLIHDQIKTSIIGFILWSAIYLAVGISLVKRPKLGYWSALFISVLQTVPLIISWLVPLEQIFRHPMPDWYAYSLCVSATLGVALLAVLTAKPSRDFIFGTQPVRK